MQRLLFVLALVLAAGVTSCTDSGTIFTFDAAASTGSTAPATDARASSGDGATPDASSDGGLVASPKEGSR